MKHFIYILLSLALLAGCSDIDRANPYEGRLNTLRVKVVYEEDYEEFMRAGVLVRVEDKGRGNTYQVPIDAEGYAEFSLTNGRYLISFADRIDRDRFNGSADGIKVVDGDVDFTLPVIHSTAGNIVFKEVYVGGCAKTPAQGTFQADRYLILHNNDSEAQYLDGLCFGTLDPYNAPATNVWITQDNTGATVFPDFVPIIQCIWQFGGDGTSFPLAPGEDAVIAVNGAVDHAAQYPLSVNLNKEGYFVCYNNIYFPNTVYHPAPGDHISTDRYLDVVIKTGRSNAYTLSVSSPTVVVFRAKGMTIQEFVQNPDNVVQKPGSTVDRVVKIPAEWVLDAVEVFDGGSSKNQKRLSPALDAGYVIQTGTFLGRSLYRRTDAAASAEAGYEVLADTNNSSQDFYERMTQSLHD